MFVPECTQLLVPRSCTFEALVSAAPPSYLLTRRATLDCRPNTRFGCQLATLDLSIACLLPCRTTRRFVDCSRRALRCQISALRHSHTINQERPRRVRALSPHDVFRDSDHCPADYVFVDEHNRHKRLKGMFYLSITCAYRSLFYS